MVFASQIFCSLLFCSVLFCNFSIAKSFIISFTVLKIFRPFEARATMCESSANERGIWRVRWRCPLSDPRSFEIICTRWMLQSMIASHPHLRKSAMLSIYLIHLVPLFLASFAGQRFMKGSIRYIITWNFFDTFPKCFFCSLSLSRPVQLFTFHPMRWLNCMRNCDKLTKMREASMQLQHF